MRATGRRSTPPADRSMTKPDIRIPPGRSRTASGRHDVTALMASQACHGAETAEMIWRSDGDHHIPAPAGFIPQVSRTILNPSRMPGRSNRTGSARAPVAEGGGDDRPLPRTPPSRGYLTQPMSPATRAAGDVRHCRNEGVAYARVYAQACITFHVQPARLRRSGNCAQPFPCRR